MQDAPQDPARLAVLERLRASALETYGEERLADAAVAFALQAAATAVWRIMQEPLDPLDPEPYTRG